MARDGGGIPPFADDLISRDTGRWSASSAPSTPIT